MERGKINFGKDIDLSKLDWSNDTINQIELSIDKIKAFVDRETTEDNFQTVCDLFYYLVSNIPLAVHNLNSEFIVRARPNFDGEVFKEKSDISYNSKNIDRIKPGRFNRAHEPMFYAAIPTGEQRQLIMPVSLECCKELIDDNNLDPFQYLTFGKWHLNESFPVIFLCFENEVQKQIKYIDHVIDNYFLGLFGSTSSEIKTIIESFWKLLSEYSSQRAAKPQHYFITTAFFLVIREYYKDLNGIMYPSSMTNSDGLNLVLTPTAVDKYLTLKEVFMYKFQRKPNNPKAFNSFIASDIAECKEDKFVITSIW